MPNPSFHHERRLRRIYNDVGRIQVIHGGKAHPATASGTSGMKASLNGIPA